MKSFNPSKIIGIATNYKGATGVNNDMLEPMIFLKSPNALANHNDKIEIPFDLPCWGEVELAVIIKKEAKNISLENAKEYIGGYTIANDITIENIMDRDHHLARAKSADGFCPILDKVDGSFEPKDQYIRAYHNGELLREAKLSDMIWSSEKIISELSQWMTLNKGDIILTGTPPRVIDRIYLKNGDHFICEIEGLGRLENKFYV